MPRYIIPVVGADGTVAGVIPVGGPVTESAFTGMEVIPGGMRRGGPAMMTAPTPSAPRITAPAAASRAGPLTAQQQAFLRSIGPTQVSTQRGVRRQPGLAQQARAHAQRLRRATPAAPDPVAQLRRASQRIDFRPFETPRSTLPRHLQPFTPENTAWLAQQQLAHQQPLPPIAAAEAATRRMTALQAQAEAQALLQTADATSAQAAYRRQGQISSRLEDIHRNREELWRMVRRGEISYDHAKQRHNALQPLVDQLNAEYKALDAYHQQAVLPSDLGSQLTAEQRSQQQAYHDAVDRLYAWMRAGGSGATAGERLRQWDAWAAARGIPHFSGSVQVG